MSVENMYKQALRGRITSDDAWPVLEGVHDAVHTKHAEYVVLDVSEVTLLCPEAVRLLARVLSVLATHGGDLHLIHPSAQVQEALAAGAWEQVFGVYDTEEEAIAAHAYEKGESI